MHPITRHAQVLLYVVNVREAAAGGAEHQLLRHLLFGEIDEVLAAAMHRQDVLEVEFLQLGHHLAQIILGRRSQVETADQRIDLLDA